MDYPEALKKVQTSKVQSNFLLISLGWDQKYVFPYKEGLAFIAAFETALRFKEEYDNKTRLTPIDRNQIDFHILSRQEYEDIQVAGLLNLKLSEVKEMRNPTPKETTEPA